MKVVRGFKTELDLNDEQRTACMKHAGASRFAVWNSRSKANGAASSAFPSLRRRAKPTPKATTAIGVDLGIRALATLSDGRRKAHPRAVKHARVANIRKDASHTLTTDLCKNHAMVGLRTCMCMGMLKNHKLAHECALVIDRDLNAALNILNEP